MLTAFLLLIFFVISLIFLYKILLSVGNPPSYWAKHGITEINANSVATPLQILLGSKNITERDDYAYSKMGSLKFCGMMEKPSPIILVKDLSLIKKILISDFNHFVDRRDIFQIPEGNSILGNMLGFLKGEEWKSVRTCLSPTLTTGKIRRMMGHFNSVGEDWTTFLRKKVKGEAIDVVMINLSNQFAVDVIGKAAFGIDPRAVGDPDSIFVKKANSIVEVNLWLMLKQNLNQRYPKIFKFLGFDSFDMDGMKFYEKIVRKSLNQKNSLNSEDKTDDFQSFLLEMRQAGEVKAIGCDELDEFERDSLLKGSSKKELLTDEMIISQSLSFFVGGFIGTSQAITLVAYALAAYPDIQDKVRLEVDRIMRQDGLLDYDDLRNLTYLDMVINETFRRHPLNRLERLATSDYFDEESGLFVEKGTVVVIPVKAIHNDKNYYKNADNFDPEHFSKKAKAERPSITNLSFGAGPRSCLGIRFAQIETKAAIAHLIHNFRIEPTATTPLPPTPRVFGLQALAPPNLELRMVPL